MSKMLQNHIFIFLSGLLGFIYLANCQHGKSTYLPVQITLALSDQNGIVIASWKAMTSAKMAIAWGVRSEDYTRNILAEIIDNKDSSSATYRAIMNDLPTNRILYYTIGSENGPWTQERKFVVAGPSGVPGTVRALLSAGLSYDNLDLDGFVPDVPDTVVLKAKGSNTLEADSSAAATATASAAQINSIKASGSKNASDPKAEFGRQILEHLKHVPPYQVLVDMSRNCGDRSLEGPSADIHFSLLSQLAAVMPYMVMPEARCTKEATIRGLGYSGIKLDGASHPWYSLDLGPLKIVAVNAFDTRESGALSELRDALMAIDRMAQPFLAVLVSGGSSFAAATAEVLGDAGQGKGARFATVAAAYVGYSLERILFEAQVDAVMLADLGGYRASCHAYRGVCFKSQLAQELLGLSEDDVRAMDDSTRWPLYLSIGSDRPLEQAPQPSSRASDTDADDVYEDDDDDAEEEAEQRKEAEEKLRNPPVAFASLMATASYLHIEATNAKSGDVIAGFALMKRRSEAFNLEAVQQVADKLDSQLPPPGPEGSRPKPEEGGKPGSVFDFLDGILDKLKGLVSFMW